MNPYSTELYHHGILGQKWGVRRFQNKDGSLTAEGKKHYDTYNQGKKLSENVEKEIKNLRKSNPKMFKKEFGDDRSVDADLLDIVLQEYGIKGKKFYEARKKQFQFINNNKESIKKGKKIAEKILKERRWDYDTGAYYAIY